MKGKKCSAQFSVLPAHQNVKSLLLTLNFLPSLKLTVRTCQEAEPQKEAHLPTMDFQGRAVSFREGSFFF